MNKINRSLVKSQAKQIIKEKIFALFVLSAIVLFLVNGLTVGISAYMIQLTDIGTVVIGNHELSLYAF